MRSSSATRYQLATRFQAGAGIASWMQAGDKGLLGRPCISVIWSGVALRAKAW